MTSKIVGKRTWNDVSLMILDIEGLLDSKKFEHGTGELIFRHSYKKGNIRYQIWCLDEEDNNKWKCVADGHVKDIEHLRRLRRIHTLEEAIFA